VIAIDELFEPGRPSAKFCAECAAKLKRILGSAGTAVGQAIWKICVDVAGEAARKILLLPARAAGASRSSGSAPDPQ
jgi:hypothetical protein